MHGYSFCKGRPETFDEIVAVNILVQLDLKNIWMLRNVIVILSFNVARFENSWFIAGDDSNERVCSDTLSGDGAALPVLLLRSTRLLLFCYGLPFNGDNAESYCSCGSR